jgi:hypothetical protein
LLLLLLVNVNVFIAVFACTRLYAQCIQPQLLRQLLALPR